MVDSVYPIFTRVTREKFLLISIHPRAYDIHRARAESDYSKLFTWGWDTAEIKKSMDFCEIITTRVWSPCVFKTGHRHSDDFVSSCLLVLDFDKPGYPLGQCLNEWCDTIHWIGTSKNHQRDKGGIVCDRFRLIVPYERVIDDSHEYSFNYRKLLERYPSDSQTQDAARLFFPCQEVVSINLEGYRQPVVKAPPKRPPVILDKRLLALRRERYGKSVPRYIAAFVEDGVLPPWAESRQRLCFDISRRLRDGGWQRDEVLSYLLAAKFSREKFEDKEIVQAVQSAFKRSGDEPVV